MRVQPPLQRTALAVASSRRARRRSSPHRVGCALAALLTLGACGYDWTVASGAGDAATGPADGAVASDASIPIDAGLRADAGVNCGALLGQLDAARTAARRCALAAGECTTTVDDACGCPVFVAVGGSASAAAFARVAAELASSGCTLGCGACPSQPVSGTCLQQGGTATLCWP